jgi:hypothetical protein
MVSRSLLHSQTPSAIPRPLFFLGRSITTLRPDRHPTTTTTITTFLSPSWTWTNFLPAPGTLRVFSINDLAIERPDERQKGGTFSQLDHGNDLERTLARRCILSGSSRVSPAATLAFGRTVGNGGATLLKTLRGYQSVKVRVQDRDPGPPRVEGGISLSLCSSERYRWWTPFQVLRVRSVAGGVRGSLGGERVSTGSGWGVEG